MRILLPVIAVCAPLDPFAMTVTICATEGDRIDSDTCFQETFEKLWRAEASALVHTRLAEVETESDAQAAAAAGTAWSWALDQVINTLKVHTNETYSWSFF